MAGHLLDQALEVTADRKLTFRAYTTPQCDHRPCDQPLSLKGFLDGACRCLADGNIKSVTVLLDAHISMVECGRASVIGDSVARGALADLPDQVKFRGELPPTAKVEIIISNLGDGLLDVLKIAYFEKPVSAQIASGLCRGRGFVPVFRPGPWAVKKAFPWLFNRIPGYHVRWHALEEKSDVSLRRSQSQTTWSTDNENLSEGIGFINAHTPECDARNEQTFWALTCIKPDSGTPIAGWPEAKVRAMAVVWRGPRA